MSGNTDRRGWLDLAIGAVAGVAVAAVAFGVINMLAGWQHVGLWHRAIDRWQAEELEQLMLRQIATARLAIEDDQPLRSGERLAFSVTPEVYEHYLAYCVHLLEHDAVDRFNELRALTSPLQLDLTGADLSNLNLQGANFRNAILTGTDLQGADLTGASFFNAGLDGADLSGATVTQTSFSQADLSNARLNSIAGSGPDFSQAVLVNASLTGITDLRDARFDSAELAECNLHGSRFPGAVFDRAGLTVASAVGTDFSEIASMDAPTLTAAYLTNSQWQPDAVDRPWLVGVHGLDPATLAALRARGGIVRPEELLDLIEPDIIRGFRAQLEDDESLPEDQRESVLFDLLRQYWMR
jgi:uncharacterized protein YjbI with pentapeptide repeats